MFHEPMVRAAYLEKPPPRSVNGAMPLPKSMPRDLLLQIHGVSAHSTLENVKASVRAASDGPFPTNERAAAARQAICPEASFEHVYSTYVEFVRRSALRLGVGGAKADEVAQQVFVFVCQRLSAFEWRLSLRTWLFAILLRVTRSRRRIARRKHPDLAHESVDPGLVADGAVNPYEAILRAEASRTIDVLLDSLERDKRVVFVMAELEDMTVAEVSLATTLPKKAVHCRLRAACTDFERAAAALRQRPPGRDGRTKVSRETEALLERGREGTPLTPAHRARLRTAILAQEARAGVARSAAPWSLTLRKVAAVKTHA